MLVSITREYAMSKTDKHVTIYVVHKGEDEEDIAKDDDDDSDDDEIKPVIKPKQTPPPLPVKSKVPISKQFFIKRGLPVTDLKSLIEAFNHPRADLKQRQFVVHLKELDAMIGMDTFKQQVINQILFFVQDLQEPQTFLHTVITGVPGTGKTCAINILAKIYCKLGILATDTVIHADRASMVGKYLGHTAVKTKEVLTSALGGVLILDEVYSLGNKEQLDIFSKECIDTLNQFLSEHVDDFVCVIAGYKDLVQECFFNSNPGLERRFPWRFTIEPYTPAELVKIMKGQMETGGWKFEDAVSDKYLEDFIRSNKECFSGNGGDTKNLIDKCKILHARRVFTENAMLEDVPIKKRRKGRKRYSPNVGVKGRKVLTKCDVDNGFKGLLESKKDFKKNLFTSSMYS